MKKVFSVFAQNLAYYNDGEIAGGWIELPTTPEKIDEYIKNVVKVDSEHEEYEIADMDNYPFEYGSIQWANVKQINKLAIIYSLLDENQKEAVQGYCSECLSSSYSINELINLCLQADEIEYYQYEDFGIRGLSNEEKIGYMVAQENGLYEILENNNIEHCFDFEKYGKELSYDYMLLDNGYIVNQNNIDLNFYNNDEINEKVQEILNENSIELEEQEIEI